MTDGRAKGAAPAPERFTVTASDGTALPLDAYRPEKRPVGCVLLIHGGGWRSGGAETLARQAAYFASRGALAVCCSYRLLSETTDVCDGLDDCARALRFVRERLLSPYGALPVTVLGDSAGGYYACCLGCTAIVNRTGTDVKRAEYVVDLNGITDLTGKWKYGLSAAHAALAEAYSPRHNVSADDAPVLIVHGDRDATVALSDAQAYMAALESAGADVTMRVLADTAHAFILFDYRHDNAYVAKILAGLADHLAARGLI